MKAYNERFLVRETLSYTFYRQLSLANLIDFYLSCSVFSSNIFSRTLEAFVRRFKISKIVDKEEVK